MYADPLTPTLGRRYRLVVGLMPQPPYTQRKDSYRYWVGDWLTITIRALQMLRQMVPSSRPLPAAEQSCRHITWLSFKFMVFMTLSIKKISHFWFSAFRHGLCCPFGLRSARNSLGQVLLTLPRGQIPQWWSYRLIPLKLLEDVFLHSPDFIFGTGKQQIFPQISMIIELWTLWMREKCKY